jgi:hypothetical protein
MNARIGWGHNMGIKIVCVPVNIYGKSSQESWGKKNSILHDDFEYCAHSRLKKSGVGWVCLNRDSKLKIQLFRENL